MSKFFYYFSFCSFTMKRKCDPVASTYVSAQTLSDTSQDTAQNQTAESNSSISLQHRTIIRQPPPAILNPLHIFHAPDSISVTQPDHSTDSLQSPRSAKVTLLDSRSSLSTSTSDTVNW